MNEFVYLVLRLNGESYDIISVVSSLPKAKKSAKIFLNVNEKDDRTIIWERYTNKSKNGAFWFGTIVNEIGPELEICKVKIDNPYFFSFIKEEK